MNLARYRWLQLLIPTFLVLYLFLVWLKPVLGIAHAEIYPFFSWRLFSHTPGWHRTANAIAIHAIDGVPVVPSRYLDLSGHIKKLNTVVKACRHLEHCDTAVAAQLYPLVQQRARGQDVEFSVTRVRIDLRDVQGNIEKLAEGDTVKPRDFYQPERAIGRWSTRHGRIWLGDAEYVGNLLRDESTALLFHADFDLYRQADTLIYVKNPCHWADLDATFFLHIFPVDRKQLPVARRQYGFDNLDFHFGDFAFTLQSDQTCIATRPLPEYAVRRLSTGQFVPTEGGWRHIWEGTHEFPGPGPGAQPVP